MSEVLENSTGRVTCELCVERDGIKPRLLSLRERHEDVDMVVCHNCGLTWNRLMRDPQQQVEFYKHENRAKKTIGGAGLRSMLGRAACIVDFMGEELRPGLRHLDVGCAEGTLLALTRAHGLEVQGLELDTNFSQYAREARNIEVLPVVLEDASLQPQSFDVVSFVHVIEHLFHPLQTLRTAHNLLRDGGLLYIEVPNLEQPMPGLRRFFIPKHNYYFTSKTLAAIVTQAGFSIIRTGLSARDGSLQILASKATMTREEAIAKASLLPREDARRIVARINRERKRYQLMLPLLWREIQKFYVTRRAVGRYAKLLPDVISPEPEAS
jgi:2-polyprenyl-3-methyl-5-hydroxy-6-metoxy-1,4-benzoquinol methylase